MMGVLSDEDAGPGYPVNLIVRGIAAMVNLYTQFPRASGTCAKHL